RRCRLVVRSHGRVNVRSEVMTSTPQPPSLNVAVFVISWAMLAPTPSFAQNGQVPAVPWETPTKATRYVFGVVSCQGCHGDPTQLSAQAGRRDLRRLSWGLPGVGPPAPGHRRVPLETQDPG